MQVIAGVVSSWAFAVKATFGQKYLELQFGLTPAEASGYKIYYIITLCGGFFVGGLVVKFFKFKALAVVRFCTVTNILYSLAALSLWSLPGCTPQRPDELFGVDQWENLNECNCTTDQLVPMCGKSFVVNETIKITDKTIISPCKAGCDSVNKINQTRQYVGCNKTVGEI